MTSPSADATSNGRGGRPQLRRTVQPAERRAVDRIAAERAAAELLAARGADLRAAGLRDARYRMATSAREEFLTLIGGRA
jgi:hypothetical protein